MLKCARVFVHLTRRRDLPQTQMQFPSRGASISDAATMMPDPRRHIFTHFHISESVDALLLPTLETNLYKAKRQPASLEMCRGLDLSHRRRAH